MQYQASFNEKLLLGNGLCVSPLKGQINIEAPQNRSMRDIVYEIDNGRDFNDYVASFAAKVGSKHGNIRYERHPVLLSMLW